MTDINGTTTATILDGDDSTGDMTKAVYDTDNDGIVDNAEKVNNHTVESDVPSNAVFTDTTYTAGTGISISNGVISNTQTSAEWGNITGTLADQTDLQNALDSIEGIETLEGTEQNPVNLNTIDAGIYIIKGYYIYGSYTENIDSSYSNGKMFYVTPYTSGGYRVFLDVTPDMTNNYVYFKGRRIKWVSGTTYTVSNPFYLATTDYHDNTKQDTLVSGTNIKTINNESVLGSGNISISSGEATDVQVNGTSITSNGVANLVTETAYNSSTNKLATVSDLPDGIQTLTGTSENPVNLNSIDAGVYIIKGYYYAGTSSRAGDTDGIVFVVSPFGYQTTTNHTYRNVFYLKPDVPTASRIRTFVIDHYATNDSYSKSSEIQYTDTYDKLAFDGSVARSSVASIQPKSLIAPIRYDDKWTALTSGSTTITVTSYGIIPQQIAFYEGDSLISSGTTIGSVILAGEIDISHSFGSTLATNKSVYLKGTIVTTGTNKYKGTFKLDTTTWWSQSLPESEDGYVYMYLGETTGNTNKMMLFPHHPMYEYKDGKIRLYQQDLEISNASTSAYGITKLSTSTSSTATDLAATPSAVKAAYDLANGKQAQLVSGTNIKTINNQSILGSGNIELASDIPDKLISDIQINGTSIADFSMSAKEVNEQEQGVFEISNSTFVIDTTGHTSAELTTGIVDGESDLFTFAQLDYTDPSNPTLEYMYVNLLLSGDNVNAYASQLQASVLLPNGSAFTDTIASDHYYYLIAKMNESYSSVTLYILEDLTSLTNYGNYTYGSNTVLMDDATYGEPNTAIWDSMKFVGFDKGIGTANLVTNTAYNASTNKIATMSDIPNISNKVTGDGIATISKLTQAQYNALTTKDNNTLYIIVG